MVNRRIPQEIKEAGIQFYEANMLPLAAILDYLQLSCATFFRTYAIWQATGDVVRSMNGQRGQPRILHFSDVDYLKTSFNTNQTGSWMSSSICWNPIALSLHISPPFTTNS